MIEGEVLDGARDVAMGVTKGFLVEIHDVEFEACVPGIAGAVTVVLIKGVGADKMYGASFLCEINFVERGEGHGIGFFFTRGGIPDSAVERESYGVHLGHCQLCSGLLYLEVDDRRPRLVFFKLPLEGGDDIELL